MILKPFTARGKLARETAYYGSLLGSVIEE